MIFLSAGIPENEPDSDFFTTSDIVAIRDAVRSLAAVVLTDNVLVYGGQPAITSLIRYILYKTTLEHKDNILLYQSAYFKKEFPSDNEFIPKKRIIDVGIDLESSLSEMRYQMINSHRFSVGIFIGGKSGVIEEFNMFRKLHPDAIILPIASTGAAAKALYHLFNFSDKRLLTDFAYKNLFKNLLTGII